MSYMAQPNQQLPAMPPSPPMSTSAASTSSAISSVSIRPPTKYLSKIALNASRRPLSADWLSRTWSVAHSTLDMWQSARNVRITYTQLAPKNNRIRLDDMVEYESNKTAAKHPVKSVLGIDSVASADAEDLGSWNWRGRGLLFWVTSHWEILGWGESKLPSGETECWVVTWFAPTMFTKEGVDIYCSRPEGLSEETYTQIMSELKRAGGKHISKLVSENMAPVEIRLPWAESDI
ncbi:hypothetical protein TD95_003336 [Thielaviopsis punctulata]|uniref:Uncharacterized protein n=1 Tax=Thielaviopsis punctulata TaxID=72032 RepID=A0A0F4Z9L5_9PEZI|nr:hypothetical protein TD95_003336 [Thielaviopsis punctulata]